MLAKYMQKQNELPDNRDILRLQNYFIIYGGYLWKISGRAMKHFVAFGDLVPVHFKLCT